MSERMQFTQEYRHMAVLPSRAIVDKSRSNETAVEQIAEDERVGMGPFPVDTATFTHPPYDDALRIQLRENVWSRPLNVVMLEECTTEAPHQSTAAE